jgi:hypothetical protein
MFIAYGRSSRLFTQRGDMFIAVALVNNNSSLHGVEEFSCLLQRYKHVIPPE